MGRPTRYTKKVGQELCGRRMEGQTIFQMAQDEHLPSVRTIQRWQRDIPEFSKAFRMARTQRAEIYGEKAVESLNQIDQDGAAVAKVKLDGYLKIAALDDRDNWSPSQTVRHAGVPDEPVVLESPRQRLIDKLASMQRRQDEAIRMALAGQIPMTAATERALAMRCRFDPKFAAEVEAEVEAFQAARRGPGSDTGGVAATPPPKPSEPGALPPKHSPADGAGGPAADRESRHDRSPWIVKPR